MEALIVGGFVFVFCFAAALPPGRNAGASADSVLDWVPWTRWSHLILGEPGSHFQPSFILKFRQTEQPDGAVDCPGEIKSWSGTLNRKKVEERSWGGGGQGGANFVMSLEKQKSRIPEWCKKLEWLD